MSPAQDQVSPSTFVCPNCGRENPVERLFCKFCRHRIAGAATDSVVPTGEPLQPQGLSQVVQEENNTLRQQLAFLQEELEKAKSLIAQPGPALAAAEELHAKLQVAEDKASNLTAQSKENESKWKLAEEKAAAFEQQLVAKAKELETHLHTASSATPPPLGPVPVPPISSRSKLIAGALAVVLAAGGYASGSYLQFKSDSRGRVSQLAADLANAQQQIRTFRSAIEAANSRAAQTDVNAKAQVDAANQKLTDLTSKGAARDAQQHQVETRLAATQRDLTSMQAQLNAANAKVQSTETASNQRIQQLQADLQARDTQIASLRARGAKQSNIPISSARTGFLIWSGTVNGSKQTVHLLNGQPDSGTVSNGPSGPLPGTACILTTPDPNRVRKMHSQDKNRCDRVQFDVSGPGPAQARIDWVTSQ